MTKNLSPLMEHSDNKDLTGHWEELGIPTVVLLLAQPKLGLGMRRYPRNGIPTPSLPNTQEPLPQSGSTGGMRGKGLPR